MSAGPYRAGLMAALVLGAAAAGCVADQPASSGIQTSSLRPSTGTFRCGDAGNLQVRRVSGGVEVTETDGDVVFLPPAPANQSTRFGRDGYALVVEGPDALYMAARSVPLDCRRTAAATSTD